MMDDLASADFETAEAAVEAFESAYAPLLTNYVLGKAGADPVQTNPIRLVRGVTRGLRRQRPSSWSTCRSAMPEC